MDLRDAAAAYRDNAIESAPGVVIVRMLYEGALKALDRAAASDPAKARADFDEQLRRADAIVVELRLALLPDAAPELAKRLNELYLFVEERFRTALRTRSHAPIAEARGVLATLFDAWSRIDLGAQQRTLS